MSMLGKIDVHAHYLPAAYREALVDAGHDQPDGFPRIPTWSAREHVAVMDRLGIAASLLSISSPGVHLADEAEPVAAPPVDSGKPPVDGKAGAHAAAAIDVQSDDNDHLFPEDF